MTCFFFTSRFQKIGSLNQLLENTHKKMCVQNAYFYFIMTSVIDIATSIMVAVVGVNILTPKFNCINKDVVNNLNLIVLVCVFGVHVLEVIIQCCIQGGLGRDTPEDNQFNPKSFWSGIFFTVLHFIKLLVLCAIILPNLKYPQETCDNTIIFFSILFVLVTFFVIVIRAIAHIKQVRQK